MTVHYTHPYLLNPQHKVTVHLVGVGGTGSKVLQCLAQLNEGLIGLGHPGLHVYVWDGDTVSFANKGRQLFSEADIGQNKAIVLVSRLNRFYGYDWEAYPQMFDNSFPANILITCIDTAAGRVAIDKMPKLAQGEPHRRYMYWMDFGNGKKTGQVVIGTVNRSIVHAGKLPQSEHIVVPNLQTVTEMFDLTQVRDEDSGPSCSLAEAINKQDLFINSTLAQHGANILWKMFREGMLTAHGCYVNLETMVVNPIKVMNAYATDAPVKTSARKGRKKVTV